MKRIFSELNSSESIDMNNNEEERYLKKHKLKESCFYETNEQHIPDIFLNYRTPFIQKLKYDSISMTLNCCLSNNCSKCIIYLAKISQIVDIDLINLYKKDIVLQIFENYLNDEIYCNMEKEQKNNIISFIHNYFLFLEKDFAEFEKNMNKGIEKNRVECLYFYAYSLIKKDSERAIELLNKCIENNFYQAYNILGDYYFDNKNYELMKFNYLKGIENNCINSIHQMIKYHSTIENNNEEVKKYLLKGVELNCNKCMNNLALFYLEIEKNDDEVIKYFLMAIEKKNISAYFYLAKFYLSKKDKKNSQKYLIEGASFKNINCIMYLAKHYSECQNCLDFKNSIKYYDIAFKLDNYHVIIPICHILLKTKKYNEFHIYCDMGIKHNLIECFYLKGYFYNKIDKNEDKMIEFYNEAIKRKDMNSLIELVKYFDINSNYTEMKKYLQIGIENDNLDSYHYLAHFYLENEKEKDIEKAIELFKIAINKNHKPSMFSLGRYYDSIQNEEEMIKYYLMCENKNSFFNLGIYYYNKLNYPKSIHYFELSWKLGDLEALKNIADAYKKLNDYPMMKKYYLIGIQNNCIDCIFDLALFYQIEEINNEEMIKLYILGVNQGSFKCLFYLFIHYFLINDFDNIKNIMNFLIHKNIKYNKNDFYLKFENVKDNFLIIANKTTRINVNQQSKNLFYAYYHYFISKNYEEMKNLIISNINNFTENINTVNNTLFDKSIFLITFYYENIEINNQELKKYLLMNTSNIESILSLSKFYLNKEPNQLEYIKYLKLAAEKGDMESNFKLISHYFENIE